MRQTIFLLTIALALVGCKKEYNGALEILEPLEIVTKTKKKKGEVIQYKETIPAGNYDGTIKVNKKNIAFEFTEELVIPGEEGAKDKKLKDVKIKVNKDAREKLKEDEFTLTAEDTNQNFAIKVNKQYDYETSNHYSGTTSCTWYTYSTQCGIKCSTVCGPYYVDENGQKRRKCTEQCGRECWTVSHPHPGTQSYDSWDVHETWTISADIMSSDEQTVLSTIAGNVYKSDSKTSYGSCN